MAKPIITLNGLKMVIMLGMLVIILTGIRFAADIIVPFILALFLAVIINPLVQLLVRCRVPRVLAILNADWPHRHAGHCAAGLAGDLA
ncbi:transporter [Klebsiella variicola]|nr:transporter [Klebsiella variicola]